MKFKRNITITIACIITECLISLIPMIFIIYILLLPEKMSELFTTLVIVPYFIFIINVVLLMTSLIAQIFIKMKIVVGKENLLVIINNKEKVINYIDIANITYDFGDLTKFNTKPSQLVLFDKDSKQLLAVNNPSIIMIYLIKKRCKNIKLSFYNNKRLILFLALINGIVLLFSLIIKIFELI